jgi:hypothetical protein
VNPSLRFFVGLHQPSDAKHFMRACISVKRLATRRKPLECPEVLLDSGAFTEILQYGRYRQSVNEHASHLRRLHADGVASIAAVVAQDYMCEPVILAKTGMTIKDHQRLTIDRYDELQAALLGTHLTIMPVLQGFEPDTYILHLRSYSDRLRPSMWVGVGSVCKRNRSPVDIINVLGAIKAERPDLRLHGFGIKLTSLADPRIREHLYSADSMAWSYAARRQGRDANDWREAQRFADKIESTFQESPSAWQASFAFDAREAA